MLSLLHPPDVLSLPSTEGFHGFLFRECFKLVHFFFAWFCPLKEAFVFFIDSSDFLLPIISRNRLKALPLNHIQPLRIRQHRHPIKLTMTALSNASKRKTRIQQSVPRTPGNTAITDEKISDHSLANTDSAVMHACITESPNCAVYSVNSRLPIRPSQGGETLSPHILTLLLSSPVERFTPLQWLC